MNQQLSKETIRPSLGKRNTGKDTEILQSTSWVWA